MTHDLESHRLIEVFASLSALRDCRSGDEAFVALTAASLAALPGADFASITRSRLNHFQTMAPTHAEATGADRLQYWLDSGPCLDALAGERSMCTGDLLHDRRWPVFGPSAARQFGISSMLSVAMAITEDIRISLNVYSRRTEAFSPTARSLGTLFAAYGAAVLASVVATERLGNVERALANSRQIGTAIGVLMATRRVTSDEAFGLLRTASQNSNRKLSDVSRDVVDTGEIMADG